MTRIVIVDSDDNPIGFKERSAVESADIYRVSALWITNSTGDILMAQRAFTKKNDPGCWGPAVAGTVDEGEEYLDNILKETEEEIGLKISEKDIRIGPKIRRSGSKNNYFSQWYEYSTDVPAETFTIRREEVEQLKWYPREALKKDIRERPHEFVPSATQWAEHLLL